MKEIELTQGKVALVDDCDYEWLNKFKWCTVKKGGTYYAVRNVPKNNSRLIYMHREILGDMPDGMDIDYIDGDGLNNQKANLRVVTRRQNSQNRHIEKSSRYPGVTWHKAGRKWQAQVCIDGKMKYLGLYQTEDDAFEAYRMAVYNLGEDMHERFEDENEDQGNHRKRML